MKRTRQIEGELIRILPSLSKLMVNYQQCMDECEKNGISYVVGNKSCSGVYEKNFVRSTQEIVDKLAADQLI